MRNEKYWRSSHEVWSSRMLELVRGQSFGSVVCRMVGHSVLNFLHELGFNISAQNKICVIWATYYQWTAYLILTNYC